MIMRSAGMLWLGFVLSLTACVQPSVVGETEVRYGKVSSIHPVEIDSPAHLGLGSIIGGVAGGVLGHQFGAGSGRDVATVAGALAGAAAGTAVETHVDKQQGQHVIVVLSNGVAVGITQPTSDLHVGEQVRIEGSGTSARVVRN
jgi:outer membrane lipoprotein SlyB